jgi:mycothiol system anti-sigma-R factor
MATSHDHGEGNCDEAIASLYHYIDGEITETTRTVVQRHLDDCSPCFEAYDFEAELRIVISAKCRDEVPESLKARIRSLIDPADPAAGG